MVGSEREADLKAIRQRICKLEVLRENAGRVVWMATSHTPPERRKQSLQEGSHTTVRKEQLGECHTKKLVRDTNTWLDPTANLWNQTLHGRAQPSAF